jgi:hypothetical protein
MVHLLFRRCRERAPAILEDGFEEGDGFRPPRVRVIESGKIDRYGRTLAQLTVNGRDVGGACSVWAIANRKGRPRSWGCHFSLTMPITMRTS